MTGRPIYLDYNATTPLDPKAMEEMLPFLHDRFGNPSSGHAFGQEAHAAVERARREVADLIGGHSDEVVFTAGGTESDNLAILGTVLTQPERRPHVITSTVEHPAVARTLAFAQRHFGVAVTALPVDGFGRVDPDQVRRALRPETVLVTIIHANNEVGTISPVAAIASIAREAGVVLHVDAAQSAGKIELDVSELAADLLTLAAHKLYGPKGIGALYIRRGTAIEPVLQGGGQEGGLRPGTENVASIVAFGAAARIARQALPVEGPRLRGMRDRLYGLLAEHIEGLELNGHPTERLPNTLNVSFPEVDGSSLLATTPQIAASTGSACHAGSTEPSAVLTAMGLPRQRALGAVRLSLGRWTTPDDVTHAADALRDSYDRMTAAARDARGREPATKRSSS